MRTTAALLTACAIAGLGGHVSAAVKVKTQFTKSFDFTKAKTWSWHDGGPGEVKMAVTADDNPEVVRQRAEPVIMEAVGAALPQRGLTAAAPGAPSDVKIKYYVLITLGTDAQTMGQFLPAVAAWGVPLMSASHAVVQRHRARLACARISARTTKSCGAGLDRPSSNPVRLPKSVRRSSAKRSPTSSRNIHLSRSVRHQERKRAAPPKQDKKRRSDALWLQTTIREIPRPVRGRRPTVRTVSEEIADPSVLDLA